MLYLFIILFVIAAFVFAYHYERNGNPWAIGDFLQRLIWAVAFSSGYDVLFWHAWNLWTSLYYILGQFVAITAVPHAFAQNMGKRTQTWASMPPIPFIGSLTIPKWWPGAPFYWVKNFTVQDFLGMMCVGALRGAIVFLPVMYLGGSEVGAIAAAIITALWQPLAYLIGTRLIPFNVWTNTGYSSTWGEFLVPVGWVGALLVSILG